MKETARLAQAREQMERRLRGRRSSSSLPAVVELVLSRPVVSAAMIAKAAKVTQRGARRPRRAGNDGEGTLPRMGNPLKLAALS
ncbi:hypothetical protein X737_32130 [Mesorhizobium sp. L48C026A00]|nr:helix-turn-helix domain-containing protein [Mesorhizobium sp. L48C026A00]ESZ10152.1 hypothetical protein X737_32130 [Mesorhizobium sp. L48C026A00]